ncbi:hypothetical protein [Pseudomonas laurylsulfatiphila]|jgi:hypothetical protein|uniref:hypothetical protein n=1 Tax=Pseudomonas laurylsulfatiphila TaxID=2011015 RepID=UPI00215FD1E2|nr:hypothetical protein [Pseudomonas laurylsulfatiphila]UVM07080.1 hypothetical protein LOY25_10410 [Pseudomonas laurylsulfatiphila]
MPNSDLLPSLLFKINENQLALEAAILELSNWVEQRGSADIADNVRGALEAIDRNEEFINLSLAVLMSPE